MGNETMNYKFPKPEEDDFYDIKEYNKAMDILDETLTGMDNKKLDKNGDISDTKINLLETVTSEFPVPTEGETTKVFMGKVKKFIENTKPLESDTTYYVAMTGSDTTGNGSATAPYATVTKALSVIPKQLEAKTATISIADGTYTEDVVISGFTNGYLVIQGNESAPNNVVIQGITNVGLRTIMNTCHIKISGLKPVAVAVGSTQLVVYESAYVFIYKCLLDGASQVQNGIVATGTMMTITQTTFNNCSNCIRVYENLDDGHMSSIIRIGTCYGINNNRLVYNAKAIVQIADNILPAVSVSDLTNLGGIIVKSSGAVIGSLQHGVTYYVATTGSDATGDGSQANPFKTIQHAIDILPKNLGGYEAVVNVASGTYSEELYIKGFEYGILRINGNVDILSDNCKVTRIEASYNTCYLFINGFSITSATATGLVGYNNTAIEPRYLKIAASSAQSVNGIYFAECMFNITNCIVSYHATALSLYRSYGFSAYWGTCIGNNYGMYLDTGSIVTKIGQQPQATIPERTVQGGTFINENGTQISGLISSGLSCTWGTLSGGYVRHGNLSGVAMVSIQLGVITNTNLSVGNTYTIAGFPLPATGNSVVTFGPQNVVDNCYIQNNTIYFVPRLNINSGAGFLINATYMTNS